MKAKTPAGKTCGSFVSYCSHRLSYKYFSVFFAEFFGGGFGVCFIIKQAEDGRSAAAHLGELGIMKPHNPFDFDSFGHFDHLLKHIAGVLADSLEIAFLTAVHHSDGIGMIKIDFIGIGVCFCR